MMLGFNAAPLAGLRRFARSRTAQLGKGVHMKVLGSTMVWICVLVAPAFAQPGTPPRAVPGTGAAPGAAPAALDPKAVAGIASYGIGMNMGQTFKNDSVALDLEAFIQGVRDALQGVKPRYSEQQLRTAFEAFQRDMQVRQEARLKALGAKNQREGQTFLAQNKTKAGVKATASGLQYQIIRTGKGATPRASDSVKVHYEGYLIDGTVFDSSVKRNEPATLQVENVIAGWSEALQIMKVGDKWRLFVPSELAYGEDGADNVIGPHATLIFDVELLGIEPPAKDALPDPSVRPQR
jgi:FKBP-type peptidyl-prolyl cis-trans isomerase FklB